MSWSCTDEGDTTTPLAPYSCEDPFDLVDRAEHLDAAALADVLRTDEAQDLVAEVGTALERVQQAHRVGVGADDHDRAAQPSLLPEPAEDPSRDLALGDQRDAWWPPRAR